MKFFADHYFQIGHSHYVAGKPCQDHALSSSTGFAASAIVSDGCSTGGNTDVGSRILTLSTLRAIRASKNKTPFSIGSRRDEIMKAAAPLLGLVPEDMLATCVYAHVNESEGFIHIQGDGAIGLKYWDGSMYLQRYDWDNNMPFYPSYEGVAREQFIKLHGADLGKSRLKSERVIRNSDGIYASDGFKEYSLREGLIGVSLYLSHEELLALEFVAVFTDGVAQVEGIPWWEATGEFLSFKNTTGNFAKRRMIRGIKDMQKAGKGPLDDIAYAVIRIEKEESI